MQDRIILITGSTQGIGYATAKLLYDSGATVILNSHAPQPDDLMQAFSDVTRVRFFQADISDKKAVEAIKAFIAKEFGRLDHFVANAGVLPIPSGIDDITDENLERTIDINLKGTFETMRVFGRYIQETSKTGSIVALTSVDGIIGEPYGAIYSATKAGIISLTKSFARKLNDPLVRVNAIAPGFIDTPLSRSTGEDPADTTSAAVIQRVGRPEELAKAIRFLLSDDASFITGQILAVDGGFTLK